MFPFARAVDTRLCAELAFLNAMDEHGSVAKRHQTLESALVGMTDWPMRGKAGGQVAAVGDGSQAGWVNTMPCRTGGGIA